MPGRTQSRIAGVIGVLIGLAGLAWAWQSAHSTGSFPAKLSLVGPVVISVGLWLAIEGPELPVRKMSPLGWVFLVLGLVAGVLFQQFLKTGRLPFLG
jgi:hypothetical protein